MSYFWNNETTTLRMFEEEDACALYAMLTDTNGRMSCDQGIALPFGYDDALGFIAYAQDQVMTERGVCLAITDNSELLTDANAEKICGYVNLSNIQMRAGSADLMIYIAPNARKLGVATRAAYIVLKYALDELRLHKITTYIPETDKAALEFSEKIGFQREVSKKGAYFINGNYVNEISLGMTVEQFRAWQALQGSKALTDACGVRQNATKETTRQQRLEEAADIRISYWELDDLFIRPIVEEEFQYNHDILYESDDYHFYENTVGLPYYMTEPDEGEADLLIMDMNAKRILFALEDTNGAYVGNVQIHSIDRKNGSFAFSFYILKQHRCKGYATKALRKIITYAFDELRLYRCESSYNDGNDASKRVMEKLGLLYEGVKKDATFYDGKYVDVVYMGITADEWNR